MNKNHLLPFKPQVGDIVFTRQETVGSRILRLLHGPFPYSHACIVGEKRNGRSTIYTAGDTGDNTKPLAFVNSGFYKHLDAKRYLRNKDFVVCRYKRNGHALSSPQKKNILNWCKSQIGEKYPAKKVAGYLKQGIKGYGIDEIKLTELIEEEHCFEGVAKAYLSAGIELNPRAGNLAASGYDGKEVYLSPYLYDVYKSDKLATEKLQLTA